MRYRYPGPKPFTEEDEALFFGRTEEKEQLNTIVQNNKLTVLFGRSGYGKSSLIQAGVVPWFKNSANYKIIEIRFSYSSTKKEKVSHLRKQLLDEFKKHIKQNNFLSGLQVNKQSPSLWQLFTTIQWEAKQEKFDGILLIMDQFEEIFNFPKNQYDNLSTELADLVYNRIPSYFQATLMDKLDDETFCKENEGQIDFIKNELPTSFLIGIRSDRLYLLDELGDVIPIIFNNRFKLKQLLTDEIKNIVEQPARDTGNFLSLPFSYSLEVIEKISSFFENKEETVTGQKTIEAFELQIICKYIEEQVIQKCGDEKSSIDRNTIVVDNSYLPDNLNEIIKNYYINIVSGINEITKNLSEFERLIIRYLIEQKLIDNKTNNRICLDKISITPLGFNDDLLDKLTETRIIRRELNTVTGQSYEISHDTLLQPIQDAVRSTELGDLKKALSVYYYDALKRANQKSFLIKWRALEKKFVNEHNNISSFTDNDFVHSQKNDNLVHELGKDRILNISGEKPKTFILNEAFQDVVSSRIKSFDFSTLKAALYALLISIVVIAFIVILCMKVYRLSERERLQRITENIPVEYTNDQEGKEKLMVFNYAFNRLKDYTLRKTTIPENLVNQFNNLYLYADTIAKQNSCDSIFKYEVLPDNRIMVLFKEKNISTPDLPGMGIIYDKNLNVLDSFPGIYDAQPVPQSNELVILSKDSIRLYKGLSVKLNYDSASNWKSFKPLFVLQKNLILGEASTSSLDDDNTMTTSVFINLKTGFVKLLSDSYDIFYLKQDSSGFIKISYSDVMSVDFEGKQNLLYQNPFNNRKLLSVSSHGIISQFLNRNYSTGYSGYSGYPGNSDQTNDSLFFLSWDKIAKEKFKSFPKILTYYRDENGYMVIASADSIRIFDNKLSLLKNLPMPKLKPNTSINSITSNKDFSKILFTASDSTLTFINANNSYDKIIQMPRNISSAMFSKSEKIIFCSESPVPGQKPGILILDSTFKTLGRIDGVVPDFIYGDLVVFKRNGKLLSIYPEKIFSQFNNTDSAEVSRWVTEKLKEPNDSILKKYKVNGNIIETLGSLFNHKY